MKKAIALADAVLDSLPRVMGLAAGRRASRLAHWAMLMALTVTGARAADFSFTGNFSQDDELRAFTFSLSAMSTVTIRTLGYAGGLNAAGQPVFAGGFDPFLSIFDEVVLSAALIGVNNDAGCGVGVVGQDPVTSACWDAYLQLTLPMGDYTVVLSQADNSPGGFLGDPFSRAGEGNFTGPAFLGLPGSFIDANLDQRTSFWALDILSVTSATAVPEPASVLLLSGAALILLCRRTTASR